MRPEFVVRAAAWNNQRAQNSVDVAALPWAAARLPGTRRGQWKFFAPDAILPILQEQNSAAGAAGRSNLDLFVAQTSEGLIKVFGILFSL